MCITLHQISSHIITNHVFLKKHPSITLCYKYKKLELLFYPQIISTRKYKTKILRLTPSAQTGY